MYCTSRLTASDRETWRIPNCREVFLAVDGSALNIRFFNRNKAYHTRIPVANGLEACINQKKRSANVRRNQSLDTSISAGDVIQLFHKNSDCYVSAEGNPNQSITPLVLLSTSCAVPCQFVPQCLGRGFRCRSVLVGGLGFGDRGTGLGWGRWRWWSLFVAGLCRCTKLCYGGRTLSVHQAVLWWPDSDGAPSCVMVAGL